MRINFIGGALAIISSLVFSLGFAQNENVKPNGCHGVSLCQAYPELECADLHVNIGFLVEQMRLSESCFAYSVETNYLELPIAAHMLRPKFKLDWGLTCGVGYHFEHDDWFLSVRLDWLRSVGKHHNTTTWDQQIIPIGMWESGLMTVDASSPVNCTYFKEAKSNCIVNYIMVEADLNRGSYIGTHLSIEPHAGLKSAWFMIDNKSDFKGGPIGYHDVKRAAGADFWGIGPKFGVDTKWVLTEGFSFVCDSSVAVLFGRTKVKDCVTYSGDPIGRHTHAVEKIDSMSPVVRGLIGFQHDKIIYQGKQHISMKVGMDTQYYWNQRPYIDVLNGYQKGWFKTFENNSIGMIGLLVDVSWDF